MCERFPKSVKPEIALGINPMAYPYSRLLVGIVKYPDGYEVPLYQGDSIIQKKYDPKKGVPYGWSKQLIFDGNIEYWKKPTMRVYENIIKNPRTDNEEFWAYKIVKYEDKINQNNNHYDKTRSF